MNPAGVPLKAPSSAEVPTAESEVTNHDVEEVERALIDASTRLPVLFFYASAIVAVDPTLSIVLSVFLVLVLMNAVNFARLPVKGS